MQIRRKPRAGEKPRYLAHSLYSAELGAHDPACYRSTPSAAPDVAALVHPGMVIRTSYGTGGTVIGVEGPYVHVAPDGSEYPHFTIVYVPSERFGGHGKLDRSWINECVTVNGRILKLFEANLGEVLIEGAVSGPR